MANTHSKSNSVAWNDQNWKKIQKKVFKLQKKIYQASVNGDVRKVRKLQKTLINSHSAKLLAVRKVTQENSGKKTGGVDKIKSLSPSQRLKLASNLKLKDKSKPVRRVWIPKANGEKRPLGIPTMYDRATQALVKIVLEPEWEAKFEENSFGFRPGRSAHDAISAIFNSIHHKPKYILDADIEKCFDRINHPKLLQKLNTYPKIRRQIKTWLKAGVADQGEIIFPEAGTPQGGIISPLLANVALHGMEERIKDFASTWKGKKRDNIQSISLIRYADDFVIIHESLEVIEQCKAIIEDWLKEYDLSLKRTKTRISHTFNECGGNKPGFDFLGFNIRQYPVGKNHSGRNSKGESLGFKTLIRPSQVKVKEHYRKLADVIDTYKNSNQQTLIQKLNPLIIGWANYYKGVCSKETYSKVDHLLFFKLQRWAYRRHPNKNKTWISSKYWHKDGNRNWVFKDKVELREHSKTPIERHTKIQNTRSPYDGDTIYWATRLGKHPEARKPIAELLKKQKGKCNHCELYFLPGDKLEIDHIIPKSKGGDGKKTNLQLLHQHCHDIKTRYDSNNESTLEGTHIEPDWRGAW